MLADSGLLYYLERRNKNQPPPDFWMVSYKGFPFQYIRTLIMGILEFGS